MPIQNSDPNSLVPDPLALKVYPVRNDNESEEAFSKRILEFMTTHNFSPEQKQQWENDKTLTFQLPRDQEAFKAFMKANPSAKLMMMCSDRDGMRQGLRDLKALGQELGLDLLKNVNKIQIKDENQTLSKGDPITGGLFLKAMESISPPKPGSTRPQGM